MSDVNVLSAFVLQDRLTQTPTKLSMRATTADARRPRLTITTSMPSATHQPPTQNPPFNFALTPELIAVGELVSAMKRVVNVLGTTFDSLDEQTERVTTLAPALKASEQLKKLREELSRQLMEQKLRSLEVRQMLDEAVKQSLSQQVTDHVKMVVAQKVKEKVAQELSMQIPQRLRQGIKTHKRQILEVQCSLHNSEARQHNSVLGSNSLTETLRPLLRPLPTAEQSPITRGPSPTATSATVIDEPSPTASPLFPRDLKSLFALKSEEAETLVKEYGLEHTHSPVTPLSAAGKAPIVDDSHERNLNKFMAHIGVVGLEIHTSPNSASSFPEENESPLPLIISIRRTL
ncbi:hypothetical protein MIND_00032400 [Mycena indigotica]|uniref:Uncharacterized protein n=1 Tax=Mycena indigotica TaxID=2126181 RepID=A0A8H6TCX6_9AGAR|nr:uncharacterized protein MIND_00032400 [Mycena indigotica]KAF7315180.1 hypothetical protein MIND_00032400 [Mycena indigotica]